MSTLGRATLLQIILDPDLSLFRCVHSSVFSDNPSSLFSMTSTTITFEKDDVQPPVFVAGSFTNWLPVEMTYKTTEWNDSAKNTFFYNAALEPGEYQYKFRLGPGDWWVLDESARTGLVLSTTLWGIPTLTTYSKRRNRQCQ